MIDFNEMYSKDKKAWRGCVSPILVSALKYAKNGKALDLGCGQGKESFFIINKGFSVTAVDSSSVAIKQIKEKIKKENLINIRAIRTDVVDFRIEKKNYDLIICSNVLYFLEKLPAIEVVKKIKDGLKAGGIVALSLFSVHDELYNKQKKHRFYVEVGEVKKLFSDFEIIEYFDGVIKDPGHASLPSPHTRGVVRIIARKIK